MSVAKANQMVGYDARFGIFNGAAVEIGTKQEHMIEYRPISPLRPGQTVEFSVGASAQYYLDLSRTRLCLNVRILHENGDPIDTDEKVALVNLSMHSIFRQVDLMLDGKNISPDVGVSYAYKSIIDTLLEEDTEYLLSNGKAEMFYKDIAGQMDDVVVSPSGTNFGLVDRYMRTQGGKEAQLSGVLHCDLMGIRSYLPNGIPLGLKLYPSQSSFSLMSSNDSTRYSIDVTDCKLLVQFIEPTSQLLLAHNELLERGPAYFPFWKSNIRGFSIPSGMTTWGIDGLFSDRIPETLIVTLVSTAAFTGSYSKNPFNFQHFGLNFLGFYIEGSPVNSTVLQPDFDNDHYVNEYLSLFNTKDQPGQGHIISWGDYSNGYAIYKFNVLESAQRAFADATSSGRAGQSRLTMRFESPLPESVMCICYARFRNLLQIDKARNVFL
jgi:hypothetical protein